MVKVDTLLESQSTDDLRTGAGSTEESTRGFLTPLHSFRQNALRALWIILSRNQLRDTSLVGSLQTIRQRIAALEDAGIHELILDFPLSAADLTPSIALPGNSSLSNVWAVF